MKIHEYNEMMSYLTRPSYVSGGRVGYRTGKTVRGSTIAMQKPVEFYVDVIRNMIRDTKYVPPVNINPREVGKIPNFLEAKELVKAETGESFDVLYNRNIQKRKKIKRALDPQKQEMDRISMAERKGRRRAAKVDPTDPVKLTPREQAINFQQRKLTKNLNMAIRENPDLVLKNKEFMDQLSTTVSKEGNIIKVKPTLDDIKNRGIVEIDHQRDIYKKGKLKDLPYNRNFILGPYNREGGFKKMAETFIEKNPDATNAKVKNIIKTAEELGVTLQPDVPKGTFPTKSVGYKQVGDPVEKITAAAKKAFGLTDLKQQLVEAPDALKLKIGGALGCVGKASGGRIGLKTGSGLMQCISSKLDQDPQGMIAKVAKEVPETRGPIRSALGMTGKAFGRFIMGALGPTGIVGMTAGFGVDPKSAVDRMGIEAEAALAPELVRSTIGATKGMKNRGAQKVVQQLLNLGMKTPTALRVARIAQPLGLLALGGEGLYKMYKEGHFEKERMMPSLMDKEAYAGAQQEQFDVNQPMFNQGGRVGLAKGPKDPSKRVFLKGVAMASLLPFVGKYFKLAAPATKAAVAYTGPILEGLGNKLKWVQLLAKRLWNEGDDITETAATMDRQIVKSGTLESGDEVAMYYDEPSGNVRFEVTPKKTETGYGYETKSGAYNKGYELEYKAPEVIEEGGMKGTKTKSDVSVGEVTPVRTADDFDFDVTESSVDDAMSDLTELEAFAKNKTTKQIHKKKGTKPKDTFPDYDPPDPYDFEID